MNEKNQNGRKQLLKLFQSFNFVFKNFLAVVILGIVIGGACELILYHHLQSDIVMGIWALALILALWLVNFIVITILEQKHD